MSDCATLWTVAPQVPLSMGILQARILEWVVMSSSMGSSWLRHLPALAAGFFTTSATSQPIPVFAEAQGNQTATLSSFNHRLYCLNILHYDFFGQTLILQKPTFHVAGSLHSPFDTTFSSRGISPNHKLPDCYRILIGFSLPHSIFFFSDMKSSCRFTFDFRIAASSVWEFNVDWEMKVIPEVFLSVMTLRVCSIDWACVNQRGCSMEKEFLIPFQEITSVGWII